MEDLTERLAAYADEWAPVDDDAADCARELFAKAKERIKALEGENRRLLATAFEVVAATEQKPDGSWVIGWDGELLITELSEVVGSMACTGCGGTKGIAELRSAGFVSCCPERSMRSPALAKVSTTPVGGGGEELTASSPQSDPIEPREDANDRGTT